jgi:hypothetical protein
MKQGYGTEGKLRLRIWAVCVAFCLGSGVWFLAAEDVTAALVCLGSVALVTAPVLAEKLLGLRLSRGFYIFCLAYALGPMLGKAYRLYYLTDWWDKLLHTTGGLVFALVGYYLLRAMNRGQPVTPAVGVLFGFCFSVAISGLWELFEFGMDAWFGMDMQGDTLVSGFHSYLLSDIPGSLFPVTDIRAVTVNGQALPGYVDIGLIDSMGDMLVETLGAVAASAWLLWDRDRHPLLRPVKGKG